VSRGDGAPVPPAGGLVRAVRVPRPLAGLTSFHKISKRRYDDISSVAVGFALDVVDGTVVRARIGLGGVAGGAPAGDDEAEPLSDGQDRSGGDHQRDGRVDDLPAIGTKEPANLRERAQRLADGRAPEAEPLHQLALADRRAGRELERDDQLTDAPGRLLAERERSANGKRCGG